MRTLSLMALASFLVLWGVYYYLKDQSREKVATTTNHMLEQTLTTEGSVLTAKKRRELDKIGAVINENNAEIDEDTKEEIKTAKEGYDTKESVKELQAMLEQSFLDRNSSMKDIKRIQSEIIEKKNKLKETVANTEKWDPRFVYYLMIQENYTYPEVNQIKSLADNGLNPEEIDYINELIREESFTEKIMSFKSQGEIGRTVASLKKTKKKEVDDFIDDVNEGPSIEEKLIEMNYNQEEKEEMVYGNNQ
jgi:hypothetical protein